MLSLYANAYVCTSAPALMRMYFSMYIYVYLFDLERHDVFARPDIVKSNGAVSQRSRQKIIVEMHTSPKNKIWSRWKVKGESWCVSACLCIRVSLSVHAGGFKRRVVASQHTLSWPPNLYNDETLWLKMWHLGLYCKSYAVYTVSRLTWIAGVGLHCRHLQRSSVSITATFVFNGEIVSISNAKYCTCKWTCLWIAAIHAYCLCVWAYVQTHCSKSHTRNVSSLPTRITLSVLLKKSHTYTWDEDKNGIDCEIVTYEVEASPHVFFLLMHKLKSVEIKHPGVVGSTLHWKISCRSSCEFQFLIHRAHYWATWGTSHRLFDPKKRGEKPNIREVTNEYALSALQANQNI